MIDNPTNLRHKVINYNGKPQRDNRNKLKRGCQFMELSGINYKWSTAFNGYNLFEFRFLIGL